MKIILTLETYTKTGFMQHGRGAYTREQLVAELQSIGVDSTLRSEMGGRYSIITDDPEILAKLSQLKKARAVIP